MKVGLYARVSTEQQIDNYSIDFQKERIKAYCASKGWNNITEYIDGGFSGSNLIRPSLQQLIADIKKKKIDVVVVYRLDRLSRSQKDTLYLIEELFLPSGVEFISLNETIDTSTPFGRAMIGILSVFAQLERETITERMRSGRYKRTKDNGYYSGGLVEPLGYRIREHGILEIKEDEAELVRIIFNEYIKLKSVHLVEKKLKELGFTPPKYQRISKTLERRIYIGEVSFGGEYFQGIHEPIVDKETFEMVQKIRSQNRHKSYGKTKSRHLLRKMRCGICGEPYQIHTGSALVLKDGTEKVRSYLVCRARRYPKDYDEKCNNKRWKKEYVEQFICSEIAKLTLDDVFQKSTKVKRKNVKDYATMIKKIDQKIEKLIDLYADGLIEKSKLNSKIKALNDEKDKLIDEENSINDSINPNIIELFKDGEIDIFSMPEEEKQLVVDTLVESILFNEEGIEITWNF